MSVVDQLRCWAGRSLAVLAAIGGLLALGRWATDRDPSDFYDDHVGGTVSLFVPDSTGRGNSGSGFFVTPHLLMTCAHVLGDSSRCEVTLLDRDTLATTNAVLVYRDTLRDIALLRSDTSGTPLRLTRVLPYIGRKVYAIGSPGEALVSLSIGHVSAYYRDSEQSPWLIKSTAATAPGSSGGPLLDGEGWVVGMCASTSYNFSNAVESEALWDAIERFSGRVDGGPRDSVLRAHYGENAGRIAAELSEELAGWEKDVTFVLHTIGQLSIPSWVWIGIGLLVVLVRVLGRYRVRLRRRAAARLRRAELDALRSQAYLPDALADGPSDSPRWELVPRSRPRRGIVRLLLAWGCRMRPARVQPGRISRSVKVSTT